MITDTMSYADIAKELEEDYKNVVRYQVHLPVKKYMKEVMLNFKKLLQMHVE